MMDLATYFRSVLLIDDSQDTREVIHRHLAIAGYTVYTCTGIGAALAFLEANPIDMLINAVRMPRASGLDVITYGREKLKRIEARQPPRKAVQYTCIERL